MIKIIFFLCCMCYSILSVAQDTTSGNANFGGRHCRGTHGLCSIGEEKSIANHNTIIGYHNHTITFTIDRNLIGIIEEFQIVGRPILTSDIDMTLFFTMDDDFTLSTTLITSLKIPSQTIVISKGVYPVYVTKEHLLITFKL